MFKQLITTSIIGIGLLLTSTASAHNNNRHHNHHDYQTIRPVQKCVSGQRIDNRQWNQKRRIRKGVKRGLLVGWEAAELKRQQRRIRKAERRMRRSDHCLTRHEARRILDRLNRASRKINKLTNNHVRRGHRHHRNNNHNRNRRNNRH